MQKDSRRGSVIRESPPSRPNVSLKVTNFSDVHSRTIYDDKHYVKRWCDTVSRDRLTKEKYGRTKRHADVTGVNITLQPVSRSTYVGSTERKRTRERTTSSTKETATVKRFSNPPEGSRSRRKDTSWFIASWKNWMPLAFHSARRRNTGITRTPYHEASRHNIRNPRKDCRPTAFTRAPPSTTDREREAR